MSDKDKLHSLPWLERLTVRVPGFGGYHRTGADRRAADAALREAIAHLFDDARAAVEQSARRCHTHEGAETEAPALERIAQHIGRVAARVRAASAGVGEFYAAGAFRPAKADALHAADHALYEAAEEFLALCRYQQPAHDWEATLQEELEEMERRLDRRAHLHRLASEQ